MAKDDYSGVIALKKARELNALVLKLKDTDINNLLKSIDILENKSDANASAIGITYKADGTILKDNFYSKIKRKRFLVGLLDL
jgi:hypothetical protein